MQRGASRRGQDQEQNEVKRAEAALGAEGGRWGWRDRRRGNNTAEREIYKIDSLSTKRKLQRKLKPNVTQISQPMTVGGVANSPLFIGFQN